MSSRSEDIGPRNFRNIFTRGRTEVANDVKFGEEASFIELYIWSKFGDQQPPNAHGVMTTATLTTTEYAAYLDVFIALYIYICLFRTLGTTTVNMHEK